MTENIIHNDISNKDICYCILSNDENYDKNTENNTKPSLQTKYMLNGIYPETILLREKDDTFIDFKAKVCIIDQYDLQSFWEYYDEYKDNSNILIDSRLRMLIFYGAIKYGDSLLIYDAYVSKIKTLYHFASDYFKIQSNELNIQQFKILFMMKLLFSCFLTEIEIGWNVNLVIKLIKQFENHDMISMMIQYIGLQKQTPVNNAKIIKVISYFKQYFGRSALDPETAPFLTSWKIGDVSMYELSVALSMLRNSNFIFFS